MTTEEIHEDDWKRNSANLALAKEIADGLAYLFNRSQEGRQDDSEAEPSK